MDWKTLRRTDLNAICGEFGIDCGKQLKKAEVIDVIKASGRDDGEIVEAWEDIQDQRERKREKKLEMRQDKEYQRKREQEERILDREHLNLQIALAVSSQNTASNAQLRMGQDLKIDLLGAIQMLKASWDNVKQSTIANCFQHAGFAGCTDEASVEESEEAGLACADEESELAETWSKLESFVGAEPQSMCIDDFVGGDDSTGTTAELTDVEIVAKVTAEQPNENAAEMDPASADDAPLPTSAEVIAALALVRRHCGAIEGTGLLLVDRLDYIEDAVVKHAIANKKQATLFQYFKPTQ
ncbi:hypothetical protein HPB49_001460 [Dermacentor silvarum]|uniref:Uncharacterized protein n=1 Tax=Dermacentor silvarum TaxID=543639 RepID=A0ACB8D9W5_DERSI|nr:hypothetical protein HPB49_001460 [Dermacentor silvarum]